MMIELIVEGVVIGLIITHILYLKKFHYEDIERDARYAKLVNDHIDKLDEHVLAMEKDRNDRRRSI